MKLTTLSAIFTLFSIILLGAETKAADLSLSLSYAQSRDFWKTVQSIQDKTGDIGAIHQVIKDKYGKPDLLYSRFSASYSFEQNGDFPEFIDNFFVGTNAEALAGGGVQNPISPEVHAYASTMGIGSAGFLSISDSKQSIFSMQTLLGLGKQKQLDAKGAEFIDAIPVRNGILALGGVDLDYVYRTSFGDNFWTTNSVGIRPIYFFSNIDPPLSESETKYSYLVLRWRLESEWLKQFSSDYFDWSLGIHTIAGQSPYPGLILPITWDYHNRLQLLPSLGSVSGIGLVAKLFGDGSYANLTSHAGIYGGEIGGGLGLHIKTFSLNASTYSIENYFHRSEGKTRIWSASIGVVL
ncbi:MAG: hypothetical protein M9962_07630 [Oligoflexia bacterium]|nr:hypothetical protein [Oligoflexia bacterium]